MNTAVQNIQEQFIEQRKNARKEKLVLHQKTQKESDDINKDMQRASRACKIIHSRVKNYYGYNLGYIKDLVIDPESGVVVYAVISFGGGFSGQCVKLFAIPWMALNWHSDEKYYSLDVDEDVLENASGFDGVHWPDSAVRWY